MTADPAELAERILATLARGKRTHWSLERLAQKLGAEAADFETAIEQLVRAGEIVRTKKGRIARSDRLGMVSGILKIGRRGRALVIPDEPDAPIAVPQGSWLPAMDGDRVLVEASPYTRRGLRSGSVRRVIERRTEFLVGTAAGGKRGGRAFVPRNPRAGYVASIDNPQAAGSPGDLLLARIVEYPSGRRGPVVRIERALGPPGSLPAEIEATCCAMGIPLDFPPAVKEEAERLVEPPASSFRGRSDLRKQMLVTIDPSDARDFDDAIGLERRGDGYALTVAIADVSHYVGSGSALDHEALERGCSVYFPGRCMPMLPEAVSGNLASLRPGEDRLALAAFLEVDATGGVVAASFDRAVIRSKRRLSYEQASAVLEASAEGAGEDATVAAMLAAMAECAAKLHARRRARGAIDLNIPELEVRVDASGEPKSLRARPRLLSHRIVEEFMLAANEAVASALEQAGYPLLYRIHEAPDEESIATLTARLSFLGLRLQRDGALLRPAVLQEIVDRVAGGERERVVHTMCLRAMQQARYSAHKDIHFGLASPCYTHFTSPIRRYPDLVVHRQLCRLIAGEAPFGGAAGTLQSVAKLASERERRAMEAERDIDRAAAVLFVQHHLGERFAGTVTGVDRRGYWVALDDILVEGFVPVGRLSEYYEYVAERMELQSRSSNRVIRIGMRQQIRVESAELADRRIDLTPIE